MNAGDQPQRLRGPAYGVAPDGTNPRNGTVLATGGMTRADKFEDEKRRFIDSCFSKKDADGSIVESYITHIRVTEDAAFPTAPPPPSSAPENKKPRLIVVAVRKSGRVRMHKARENANGTFSIGKTWVLDDLTAIQAFGGSTPANLTEQQYKEWASNVGFLVTIGKPYYWQAATAKEKDFFIASLVKIFKKYTGGRTPELIGFDPREQEALLSGNLPQAQSRAPPSVPPQPSPAQGRPPIAASRNLAASRERSRERGTPTPPYQNRSPSRDGSVESGKSVPQSKYSNRVPSREGNYEQGQTQPLYYNRAPSREGSREPFLRNKASREQTQRMPGQFPSNWPQQDLTPQSSHSQLSRDQTSSPANSRALQNGLSPTPPPPASQSDTSSRTVGTAPSLESLDSSMGGKQSRVDAAGTSRIPASNTAGPLGRDGSPYQKSVTSRAEDDASTTGAETLPVSDTAQDQLPERRRPTFQGPANNFGQKSARNESAEKFSTPMAAPGARDADARAPSRSSDRSTPSAPLSKTAGYFPPASQKDPTSIGSSISRAGATPDDSSLKNGQPDTLASIHDALSAPTPLPEVPTPTAEPKEDLPFRPGLGPMMKKKSSKDIAMTFRKAANAYNAFKPRAGGAGEKFLTEKDKMTSEPDGITGVVPAPIQRGIVNDTPRSVTPDSMAKDRPLSPTNRERPFSPMGITFKQETPKVQITRTSTEEFQHPPVERQEEESESPDKLRSRSPGPLGERRRKRTSDNSAKYLNALGIDPIILEGRGTEFDVALTELGWNGRLNEGKKVDDLEADIRREIGRVQAGSWLGHMEQQEGKIEQLAKMFDRCVEECEELDGLLTLYAHELNTLNDDIAYVEAQSQGLQVQTANQKLLQTELQNLLNTLSISSSQLQPLKEGSLSTPDGVERIETSLSTLYQAMVKIDPSMRHNRARQATGGGKDDRGNIGGYAESEVGSMRAVREKKEVYHNESLLFVQRLQQHMSKAFSTAARRTVNSIERSQKQLRAQNYKVDSTIHDGARQEIWMYSPLMLFTRDVDITEWEGMMRSYERAIKVAYQDEFRDSVAAWTNSAKKPSGEEQDALFTSQEKEPDAGIAITAARKLTVKRGKTVRVAGSVRQPTGNKKDGKMEPFEAFSGALEEMTTLIFEEQNFITHFFHATSHSSTDFADAAASARPQNRSLPKLTSKQTYDPDRDMAKRVSQLVEDIYPSWATDVQNLVDWALKPDQLQAVGVLYAIEKRLSDFEETNQEFLIRTLQKVHNSLGLQFSRFVEEQIRAIEETKVKIKKRKGVIALMKTFPGFSTAIENMLPAPEPGMETLDVRFTINDAYAKINRAMWESLKFIAKESPAGGQTSGGDPEDKETLNYHILLIENMNHYVEEVEGRDNIVLEEWRDKASHDMSEHLKLYLDAVIRRPLGKLLDFVESVESLLPTVNPPSNIATRASHSRSTAKKVYGMYDSKEIRRGIDTLKKRVEKHFGDADDPGLSRSLVSKVLRELESRYGLVWERAKKISELVYEGTLEVEWKRDELPGAFRR